MWLRTRLIRLSMKRRKRSRNVTLLRMHKLRQTKKKLKETLSKLFKCDKARKSVEVSIESSERQVREQLHHLREAERQLAIAREKFSKLNKELEQKTEEMGRVEQAAFDLGQKEIEAHLKSQIPVVC